MGDERSFERLHQQRFTQETLVSKSLLIYPEKCLGCRICEMFCSLSHTDTCNPACSCVNVVKMNLDVHCVPMMCRHCAEPACQTVCPTRAIHRSATTGAVETDSSLCIGCRTCAFACPVGGTAVDSSEGVAIMRCDLCGGEPRCAEVCPYGAVVYAEAD
jgi:Fe-S-cluster-containing hydrogenase component 2